MLYIYRLMRIEWHGHVNKGTRWEIATYS